MNKELVDNTVVRKRLLFWILFYCLVVGFVVGGHRWAHARFDTNDLPDGQVTLSLSKSKYELGETVGFTLHNYFPSTVFVGNSCPEEPLSVFKWNGSKWVQIHGSVAEKDCSEKSRLVSVEANGTLTGDYALWHDDLFSKPGQYRVVALIEHYNTIPYQDFEILQPVKEIVVPADPVVVEPSVPVVEDDDKPVYEDEDEEDEHEEDQEDEEDENQYEDEEDD